MAERFHVLVDLDGTITDPRPGIVGSFKVALAGFGIPAPPDEDLLWVIGPPMRLVLPQFGVPPERIEEGVAAYRAAYAAGALYDAPVYAGIPEALDTLSAAGCRLLVATSKPHHFARPILDHFGLTEKFAAVYGSELDGRNDDKGDLIAEIIAREGVDPRRAVMVGDRKFDARAAARHGMACIGALWGYGGPQELTEAGATMLCAGPAALAPMVLALKDDTRVPA